ncbi:MAG: hypothetical protein AAFU67_04105 [Bacteroidota bacterium]
MNEEKLNELIERYYAGETSLDEERWLREHFLDQHSQGSDSLESRLAKFFATQSELRLSKEQSTQLRSRITKRNKLIVVRRMRFVRLGMAIAASLLLVLSVWWSFNTPFNEENGHTSPALAETTDWSRYEVTDPEEAAAILMSSLRTVSTGLKEGKAATVALTELKKLTRPTE